MTAWIAIKKNEAGELPGQAMDMLASGGHGDAWEAPPPDGSDVEY